MNQIARQFSRNVSGPESDKMPRLGQRAGEQKTMSRNSICAAVMVVSGCSSFDSSTTGNPSMSGMSDAGPPNLTGTPTSPRLTVDTVADSVVLVGGTSSIAFSLEGMDLGVPVNVSVSGLPSGVTAEAIKLTGVLSGSLSVSAAPTAMEGFADVTLSAEAQPIGQAAVRATRQAKLLVRDKAGAVDKSYGDAGQRSGLFGASINAAATDAALTNDGRLVVVGQRAPVNGLLVRLAGDGRNDATFGTGGVIDLPTQELHAVGVQPDGKILHGGLAGGAEHIFRYNQDGSLDTGFGSSGSVLLGAAFTNRFVTLDDGFTVAYAVTTGARVVRVARYAQNGVLSANWGTNNGYTDVSLASTNYAIGFGVKRTQQYYVYIEGTTPGGYGVAQLTTSGTFDPAFASGTGNTYVPATVATASFTGAVEDDTGAVISVFYQGNNTFVLVKFTATGGTDPIFGTNGVAGPFTLGNAGGIARQKDGKLIVSYTNGLGVGAARFSPSGAIDTSFGSSGTTAFPYATASAVNTARTFVTADEQLLLLTNVTSGTRTDVTVTRVWL